MPALSSYELVEWNLKKTIQYYCTPWLCSIWEHASTERGLLLSFFSGGTTRLREKHPVCTNSVLSSVQAFMGRSHAAFGNRHLMPGNGDTSVTVGNHSCIKRARHLHQAKTQSWGILCTLRRTAGSWASDYKTWITSTVPWQAPTHGKRALSLSYSGWQRHHQNDTTLSEFK